MSFDKNVFIEAIRGNDREYVVKDKVGIILGRFFLKDLDSKNKKVADLLKRGHNQRLIYAA